MQTVVQPSPSELSAQLPPDQYDGIFQDFLSRIGAHDIAPNLLSSTGYYQVHGNYVSLLGGNEAMFLGPATYVVLVTLQLGVPGTTPPNTPFSYGIFEVDAPADGIFITDYESGDHGYNGNYDTHVGVRKTALEQVLDTIQPLVTGVVTLALLGMMATSMLKGGKR